MANRVLLVQNIAGSLSRSNIVKVGLGDSLNMQSTIYSKMESKGWYAPQQAEQNKIDSVRQQYSGSSM